MNNGSSGFSVLDTKITGSGRRLPLDEIAPGKALLFPVVKMLSKMTERPEVAREEMAEYGSQDALED